MIYILTVSLLPKKGINFLGSLNILSSLRNWLFETEKVLKPRMTVKWNNFIFYFRAPLQILRKAKTNGIEASLTRSIIKLIKKDSNVIDVGANYGFISIVCAKYVKNGGGMVYSFECDERCFENLQSSIKDNNLNNTKLFLEFVGEKNDNTTKSVDSLLFGQCKKIDLIKIDTDGTDLKCLKGCEKILKAFHPIIVIEINDNFDEITKFLLKVGYQFFYNQHLKEIDITEKNDIPNLFTSKYQLMI